MKKWRIVYSVLLIASLGLSFAFYYRYQLKDSELTQYERLSQITTKVLKQLSTKLIQSKEELEESLSKVKDLNLTIAALEKDNLSSQSELQALRQERDELHSKIAKLTEEKAMFESNFLALEAKFRSLEELRKAIKIVRKEQVTQKRLAKIATLKRLDEIALLQGNRGYMIKDGTSTFKQWAKIKVDLEPLDQ